MRKQSLVLGVAVLLISGGIASAQIAVPPGQDNPVATPPSVATPDGPRRAAPQKILDAGAMHRSTKSAILTGE